jgi:hypothetical protein
MTAHPPQPPSQPPSRPPQPPPPPSLPPSPWILLDRISVEQAAAVFERLEEWLAGGNPTAARLCARACSLGEADADEVAAWLGTLAAHLHQRLEISDADSDAPGDPAGADPWS